MSSKLKPNNNKKKTQATASRIKFWSLFLCALVLVVATVLILFKMGVFAGNGDFDPVGKYEVTHMMDPTTGITTPVEQMKEAMEMVGPGEALITIELLEDGSFTFEPHFDLMVRFEGKYKVEGNAITMTANDDTSGAITGSIGSRTLTITDSEGYKMTFQKVD